MIRSAPGPPRSPSSPPRWTRTDPDRATGSGHWPRRSRASQIALAFLTDDPNPHAATHRGQARIAAFCRRHSYRGAQPAAELLERLRSAPLAPVGLPADTLSAIIGAQFTLLRSIHSTITTTEKLIAARLAEHPCAQLLNQLPGVGMINLAQLLAQVGPILDRVESAEQAATECGVASLTRASGKDSGVFRWTANTRAPKAITAFTHNARMQSP